MSCKTLLCLLLAAAAVLWGCAAECVATSVGADTVKASLSPGRVMTVKLLACGSTLATPPRDACDCHPDSIVVALANGSVGALVAAAAAVPGAGADPCRGGSGAGNATLTQPSCTGATQAAAAAQSGSEVTVPLVDGIGVVNISSAVPGNSTLLLNPPRGVRPAAQQPQQQQQQQQAADVSITWAHAVRVMLLPHEATRRPGEAVQATALVLDGSGQPIRGALVSFKMYGVSKLPALSSPSALTDNKGVAAVTLTGATPCSTALVAASQADGSGAAVASAPAHVTFEEPKAAAELEAEDARGESAAGVYDWGSAGEEEEEEEEDGDDSRAAVERRGKLEGEAGWRQAPAEEAAGEEQELGRRARSSRQPSRRSRYAYLRADDADGASDDGDDAGEAHRRPRAHRGADGDEQRSDARSERYRYDRGEARPGRSDRYTYSRGEARPERASFSYGSS